MDEDALKSGGFIKLRGTGRWALRIKLLFGDVSPSQLRAIAAIADEYGDGEVHLTVRQGLEVRGVRAEEFEAVSAALESAGLQPGGGGALVRAPVACPGSAVCARGLNDTRVLAAAIDERLYGRGDIPHKFKTAVTGCASSCARPQGNDLGFMGAVGPVFDERDGACVACGACARACPVSAIVIAEDGRPVIDLGKCERDGACVKACPTSAIRVRARGWRVFLGGKFGRRPALGYEIARFASDAEAIAIAEAAVDAYARLGKAGERLRDTIDRVGLEAFAGELTSPPRAPLGECAGGLLDG